MFKDTAASLVRKDSSKGSKRPRFLKVHCEFELKVHYFWTQVMGPSVKCLAYNHEFNPQSLPERVECGCAHL